MKFLAAIQGVEIKDEVEKTERTIKPKKKIENMTAEEKKELTDKMMAQHRMFFSKKTPFTGTPAKERKKYIGQ